MNIFELKNQPAGEIKDFLDAYSTEVKDQTYMKPLSQDELHIKREELAQIAMQQSVLLDELASVKKDYKLKLDPLSHQFSQTLTEIKTKSVEVNGKTYKVPDYDNQMIHFVSEEGMVISSRAMLPEERQYTIQRQLNQAI